MGKEIDPVDLSGFELEPPVGPDGILDREVTEILERDILDDRGVYHTGEGNGEIARNEGFERRE